MVKKLLATLTTDSQGRATYTYTGTGAGDVKFSAESTNNGSLVSVNYIVHDRLFYDDATIDKTSKYIQTNMSTFSYADGYYIAKGNTVNSSPYRQYLAFVYPNVQISSTQFKITGEIQFKGSNGLQGLGAFDTISQDNNVYHGYSLLNMDSTKGLLVGAFNRTNGRLSSNVWYSFEFIVNGNTVTGIIKQGDTVVFNSSSTIPDEGFTSNPYASIVFMGNSQTIWFKNFSVESL